MRKPRNIRKIYEKRNWDKLIPGGNPVKTDRAGARSAYSYFSRNLGFVHTEKDGNDYYVWRIE